MRWLQRLPVRRAVARELDEELAFHLEMRTAELIAQGWSPEAARAEAARQFGDLAEARAFCRHIDTRREHRRMRTEYFAELRQDVGFALRALRRAPVFALIAVVTLALGIGANTAIFSVVRGILLRPLPFAEPNDLVLVVSTFNGRQFPYTSPANLADWQSQNRSFSGLAAYTGHSAVLTGAGEPEEIDGADVGPDFFGILRAQPVVGRLVFSAAESAWRGPKVVILGESVWRARFGGDPAIVGGSVTLDNERYQVIGVAPSRATYPSDARLWFPYAYDPAGLASSRAAVYLSAIGRLKPGVALAAAGADMATISSRLVTDYPEANQGLGTAVVPLHQWITGSLDRPLLILLGGVGFVLLIACANVANLLLVRGVIREGELAVRTALGAGRGRLIRQLVTESLVLALVGAAAGLVLAVVGTRFIVATAPESTPRLDEIRLDGMVLGFTLGIAVLTGTLFGLLPARMMARPDLSRTLREGGRGGGGSRAAGNRARRVLVVAEVALSVILLAGAGLLIRSFNRLLQVDPGFRTEGVVTFGLGLPDAKYPTGDHQTAFMADLLERLRNLPGVTGADAGMGLPLTGFRFNFSFAVAGRPTSSGEGPSAEVRVVTSDYFATMGMRVARGRVFTEADRPGGPRALVLNEAAVRRFFPGEEPIGKHVKFGWGRATGSLEGDIVGVVADIKERSLAAETVPQFWAAYPQWPVASTSVVIRADRDLTSVVADARRIVHDLDPELALSRVRTLAAVAAESVAQPRFYMVLLTTFAAVAIVLSGIGIYGVTAYLVGQRGREIGIRIALGASRQRVVRMIVREGAGMAAIGLVIGTVGALALTRVMSALLYGVATTDPITYVAVTGVLLIAAVLACWEPARRATRVDPTIAMRAD